MECPGMIKLLMKYIWVERIPACLRGNALQSRKKKSYDTDPGEIREVIDAGADGL
jgi:hypothetical protein